MLAVTFYMPFFNECTEDTKRRSFAAKEIFIVFGLKMIKSNYGNAKQFFPMDEIFNTFGSMDVAYDKSNMYAHLRYLHRP